MTESLDDDFDAALVAKPMRYRFKPEDDWAVIPEPSTDTIIHFFEQWLMIGNRSLERAGLVDPPKDDKGEWVEEPIEVRNERISMNLAREAKAALEARDERIDLVAEVCSNTPDAATLRALGHRARDGFYGYIVGKLSPQT